MLLQELNNVGHRIGATCLVHYGVGFPGEGQAGRRRKGQREARRSTCTYIHLLKQVHTRTVCLQLRSVYRLWTYVQHMQMYILLVHRLNGLSDTSLNTVRLSTGGRIMFHSRTRIPMCWVQCQGWIHTRLVTGKNIVGLCINPERIMCMCSECGSCLCAHHTNASQNIQVLYVPYAATS